MNGAGLFLAVAGVWVLTQVLAGDALQRLGVFARSKDNGGLPLPGLPFDLLNPGLRELGKLPNPFKGPPATPEAPGPPPNYLDPGNGQGQV